MTEKNDNEKSGAVIVVSFIDGKTDIIIRGDEANTIYENGYFGTWLNETDLSLTNEELLLLVERNRIRVVERQFDDEESEIPLSLEQLVNYFKKRNKEFWGQYLVYKDLRNRGYIVKVGTQITTPLRIYPRGGRPGDSVSKITVFPFSEGSRIDLDFLDQIVSQARLNRKKLLLAVIDRLGDVTYYQVSELELKVNQLEYEYRDELERDM